MQRAIEMWITCENGIEKYASDQKLWPKQNPYIFGISGARRMGLASGLIQNLTFIFLPPRMGEENSRYFRCPPWQKFGPLAHLGKKSGSF